MQKRKQIRFRHIYMPRIEPFSNNHSLLTIQANRSTKTNGLHTGVMPHEKFITLKTGGGME
jgi:hypothetical protein